MATEIYTTCYPSPIGVVKITGTDTGICSTLFCEDEVVVSEHVPDVLKQCVQQLDEYFTGQRRDFDLPLVPAGTVFQQQVWEQLKSIPFGKTNSYMDVARSISGEKAIRAVGAANGRNPLCILVPCHRVIGSDGSLTGYAGGLWRKEWLLRHEGILQPEKQLTLF
ncbi:methylated-DNA--[protein]-cysteine S-methyltransferase [Pontibacter vulgaris]|uniref:methylated-DNA--[protein]-cysteine S-methyltransferase n=1 Tax=Pontibacter vulgaris TaxID=2905679 RepID=UPI001FA7886C|nr:methylated-DNA--[protein]-cysteine S-methyltransferase [Pontibacter vulgaris]